VVLSLPWRVALQLVHLKAEALEHRRQAELRGLAGTLSVEQRICNMP
jgi:hypothetical protein